MESATTRGKPGAWIGMIQTRWNEDDICGRILPEDYSGQSGRILCRDGQYWEVVNIPAKAEHADDPLGREPGQYLWPEWFPPEHWAQWEQNPRAARTWSALFQQRPTAGEGLEFKREWFKWYDPDVTPGEINGRPKNLTLYGATDMATKEDKGDFTEHGVMGMDSQDKGANFWFIDWWYGQKTTDVGINNAVALISKHHPRRWWDEGGPIDNAIGPAFQRAMREAEPPVYVKVKPLPSIKNKAIKLASFQARAAQGKVYLPLRRPWATRLVDQLCAFPAGKYDDACDVCGLLGRGVDDMMAAHDDVTSPRKQGLKPFTAAWLESEDDDMKFVPRYA
jgi:predicted phage terminase large subunit-like protein